MLFHCDAESLSEANEEPFAVDMQINEKKKIHSLLGHSRSFSRRLQVQSTGTVSNVRDEEHFRTARARWLRWWASTTAVETLLPCSANLSKYREGL